MIPEIVSGQVCSICCSALSKYASKPILSRAVQKTLSYIAYSQPISSRQLVEVRGSGVYSQLKELRQLNLAKTLSKFNENKLVESIFKKLRKSK